MILLTGATGTIGRELLPHLLKAGSPVRALVRDPRKIASVKKTGAEIAYGDLSKLESLESALKGARKVFLLSSASPDQRQLHLNLIKAARNSGVEHIVRVSALGADPASQIALGKWHGESEKDLEASGIAFTHLRPHYFMQNFFSFASTVAVKGEFYAPMKDASISMVDARDVAETASACLLQEGHQGKTYSLTGPEALSFQDAASKLSSACGRPVRYMNASTETARQSMLSAGYPAWLVEALLELYGVFSAGKAASVSPDVERILGRPARSFDSFSRDFASILKGQ